MKNVYKKNLKSIFILIIIESYFFLTDYKDYNKYKN